MNNKYLIFISSILLLVTVNVHAKTYGEIDYDEVFPRVVQGIGSDSRLTIFNGSIVGTGGEPLNYGSDNGDGNSISESHCYANASAVTNGDSEPCSTTGLSVTGLDLPEFLTTTSSLGTSWGTCQNLIAQYPDATLGSQGNTEFGSIVLDSEACSFGFSDAHDEYRIKNLTIQGDITLTLPAGDYWIETLSINDGKFKIEQTGNVRLFVKTIFISSSFSTLALTDIPFTLISYSDVAFNNKGSVFNGYIYSEGTVTVNGANALRARITSKNLTINNNSWVINYDPDDFNSGGTEEGLPDCSDIFTDPPSGNHGSSFGPPDGVLDPWNPPTKHLKCLHGQCFTCVACNGSDDVPSSTTIGPGDYEYVTGDFDGLTPIQTTGPSARLFFSSSLTINDAQINVGNPASNLIMYASTSLSVHGTNYINGILYSAGALVMSEDTIIINGGVASSGPTGNLSDGINVSPDEIDIADFTGMCNNSGPGEGGSATVIDHYEIHYDSSPFVCEPLNMTVKACLNADCSELYEGDGFALMTPSPVGNGAWSLSSAQLSDGMGDVSLQYNDDSPITIGVDAENSLPEAAGATLCSSGGDTPTVEACTNITFALSGFEFDVPNKLSNKETGIIKLKALEVDPTSSASQPRECVPTFADVDKEVSFWSEYTNPNLADIIGLPAVSVNSTTVGLNDSNKVPVTLQFDSNGEADIKVNYPDAGEVELHAQYLGTDTSGGEGSDETGLELNGSDLFISYPVAICLQEAETSARCDATDPATCNAYKIAGEDFPLIAKAVAWEDSGDEAVPDSVCDNTAITPNFSLANIPLGSALYAPTGGNEGYLGTDTYIHTANADATTEITQSISEVGVFTFNGDPDIAGNDGETPEYLGSGHQIPIKATDPIGRFIPDHFILDASLIPSCSGTFTYMDQPLSLTMTLQAVNLQCERTLNYTDDFAKGEISFEAFDGVTELSDRMVIDTPVLWSHGLFSFDSPSTEQVKFSRIPPPFLTNNSNRDGPYQLLDIGVNVNDSDSVKIADTELASCTVTAYDDSKIIGSTDMRHGRMVMENTYGPSTEILMMPVNAQYWDGSQWVINTDDSCSIYTNVTLPSESTDPTDPSYPNHTAYFPSLVSSQQVTRTANSTNIILGESTLNWEATGTPLYRGKVTAPLGVEDWMQWYWQWNDTVADPESYLWNPRASAYFGRYRGDDRIIDWREVR